MGETTTRKPRAPKPAPLLPLEAAIRAVAVQAQLDEARSMLARTGEDEAPPGSIPSQVARRAMATGLQAECTRLEAELRELGFIAAPAALPAAESEP